MYRAYGVLFEKHENAIRTLSSPARVSLYLTVSLAGVSSPGCRIVGPVGGLSGPVGALSGCRVSGAVRGCRPCRAETMRAHLSGLSGLVGGSQVVGRSRLSVLLSGTTKLMPPVLTLTDLRLSSVTLSDLDRVSHLSKVYSLVKDWPTNKAKAIAHISSLNRTHC